MEICVAEHGEWRAIGVTYAPMNTRIDSIGAGEGADADNAFVAAKALR